ncbi:MAG: DUF4238 domain-containing protein [Lachnospiraceae bacterium]|nr:DUF4238 domain-containing protein [Lachnospiraceae bacterium]
MMNKEPIKHHYIPQFILRNFCFDGGNRLYYFNKKTSEICERKTNEIFMVRNLYRDNINNPDEPAKIEKDMARFESEVSRIIAEKFLRENEISISLEDNEKLKLFFALMGFRSKITSNTFGAGASEESKGIYFLYQKNGDLSDFWKRNLGKLVNCRSLKEVCEHNEIDDPIKIFMCRDILGIFGLYFIVAERRGTFDFVISDSYPTIIYGEMENGLELILYSIIPISPDRVILLVANGATAAPERVRVLNDEVLRMPKINMNRKIITIHVRKIYEREVEYLNSALIKEAHEGVAFRDKSRVMLPIAPNIK